MTPESRRQLLQAIDNGVRRGVRKALLEHKRAGRSIFIWRDGKVVEIPPEEIPVSEEAESTHCQPAPTEHPREPT